MEMKREDFVIILISAISFFAIGVAAVITFFSTPMSEKCYKLRKNKQEVKVFYHKSGIDICLIKQHDGRWIEAKIQ